VEKQISPREKYLIMADGRDAGLRSTADFILRKSARNFFFASEG
jgi:hypothetical protein